jgi:hypothetical protein
LNGDPNYDDSWLDIGGYSKLVVDELRAKESEKAVVQGKHAAPDYISAPHLQSDKNYVCRTAPAEAHSQKKPQHTCWGFVVSAICTPDNRDAI